MTKPSAGSRKGLSQSNDDLVLIVLMIHSEQENKKWLCMVSAPSGNIHFYVIIFYITGEY